MKIDYMPAVDPHITRNLENNCANRLSGGLQNFFVLTCRLNLPQNRKSKIFIWDFIVIGTYNFDIQLDNHLV